MKYISHAYFCLLLSHALSHVSIEIGCAVQHAQSDSLQAEGCYQRLNKSVLSQSGNSSLLVLGCTVPLLCRPILHRTNHRQQRANNAAVVTIAHSSSAVMNSDPQPLLTAAAASSPPSSPSSPPTTSGGSSSLSGVEVGSFPCLAHPLLQRPLAALDTAWNTIRDRVPPLRPLLLYAEDHELRGLMLVLMLVTAFVHVGMTRVLQPIEWSWLRVTLQLLFAAQALVGYASLFLFRACDPGFLPINEGAIGQRQTDACKALTASRSMIDSHSLFILLLFACSDAETAELLSRPEYSGTGLVPTREFAGEYLEWEVAAEAAQREADEAAGIFDHLDAELYGLAPPPLLQEWCRTCRVWRPPRAAHCYKCQRCVRRSDHHCTALGACGTARRQQHSKQA